MRIAICALSAVLLSGCSWLGGINNVFGGGGQGAYNNQAGQYGQAGAQQYAQAARNAQYGAQGQNPQYGQGFGGGFPQQPQFGQPQEVTGQYGTHAANANQAYGSQRASKPTLRKPRFRGSLSLGLEKSQSGDLIGSNFEGVPFGVQTNEDGTVSNVFGFTNDTGFSGSPVEGLVITSDLTAIPTDIRSPSISFDDVHSTPLRIAGGLEYIATPRTTLFANVGYSYSEGNEGGVINVIGTAQGDVNFQGFDDNIPVGQPAVIPRTVENLPIVQIAADFSDLERYDGEIGVRHYFNPILRSSSSRSITPFVAASVGAARLNGLSFKAERQNLDLHAAVADIDSSIQFTPQLNTDQPIEVYDSQWVGTGQLNAGLEWQATPKTAIAFETGVRIDGARNGIRDADGNRINGDTNVSIPFTIRGSYNF